MPALLQQAGAQPQKQPAFSPLFIDRKMTGLYTQRNPLHDPSDVVTAKFYGGRPDSLWMGSNIELTNRLTLQRRPGLIPFSTDLYPTPPNRTFAFELTNGTIQVLVDTGSTGNLSISSVANASGGTTVYTGVFPNGGSNAYVGLTFQITGFVTNQSNNGTFTVTASTTTTLTVNNTNGIAETHTATAVSAGAVYYDIQNGSTTLLFPKSPGAGQGYFVAVAGILYYGDGVDQKIYTPLNTGPNGTIFGFGVPAPTVAPTVLITESGTASTAWTASTVFSTMGLVKDTGTGDIFQLLSVNALTTNTNPNIGTSGSGQPPWNQSPGGTTSDTTGGGTITWTNRGPIVAWTARTVYNNATLGGTLANPCIIYDPVTQAAYVQSTAAAQGTSGNITPTFKKALGQHTIDGSCVWIWVGPGIGGSGLAPWLPSQSYPLVGTVSNNYAATAIVELTGLSSGLPTAASGQTLYLQVSGGGTSGSGYTPFGTTPVLAGNLINDNQLTWMSLGSFTWTATTGYSQWSANGTVFSAIVDSNNNFQVCIQTGVSGGSQPTWGVGYGVTTIDGSVIWTNVGDAMSWATNTKWFLPTQGFFPPNGAVTFGGASILDTNIPPDVEFSINSGLSGTIQPTWTGVGTYIDDNGTSFTLSQVTVGSGIATYTGTGLSGLSGQQLIISGFTNAGNNGYVVARAGATSTTFTVALTSQVNETHAGTAKNGLIWFNEEIFSTQSLAFQKGYSYAYSYKSRSLTDFYTVDVAGTSQPPIPPGLSAPLPFPTGSLTGDVSSASPATVTPTGPNPGAVLTISGPISTNPAVDTIIIWRSTDGGGTSNMFELTEIPNAPNGGPGIWSFRDFLPDVATTIGGVSFPGLNQLIDAPIDGVNNPPPAGFLPMAFNFERIWGSVGSTVYFSGGPDTLALGAGNGNSSFNIADSLPFLATVVRLVKTPQGLVTFLTDSIELIQGGPSTASFFSTTLAPGIGLGNYNGLDVYMGEIFFFSSDNQLMLLSPSLNASTFGFPLGDQFANIPSSGVSDTTWNPATVYVAVLQSGIDNALFVGDGATGFYRCNPHQVPGYGQGPQPVWSPYANITGGCKMLYTTEVQPGIKKLLVGSPSGNKQILERSLTTFTDNGTAYPAFYVMGSITLANSGQIAILKHLEMDMNSAAAPTVSFLLNDVSGTFTPFTLAPRFDPPQVYGTQLSPQSYNPLRYYFTGVNTVARCRHLQIKVAFPATGTPDEVWNTTIFGRLFVEA
jgi:hypothetical protein